jgi:helix-turn-helix protein
MKIYEKPSVDIKKFDVEDIMATSTFVEDNTEFGQITGSEGETRTGVVFAW